MPAADKEEEKKALLDEEEARASQSSTSTAPHHARTLDDLGKPENIQKSKWDSIVPADSFELYPDALCFARTVKVLLIMVVVGSIGATLYSYFSGVVLIQREIYFYEDVQAPSIAICPDYGAADFESFEPVSAKKELLPRSLNTTNVDMKFYDCVRYAHCHCLDFPEAKMLHHENGIEFLEVRFKVKGAGNTFLFGFNEPGKDDYREVPHTFNYGLLHQKTMGHLNLHIVERKLDRLYAAGGGRIMHYDFQTAGMSVPSHDGETILIFGFKTFFITMDRAVSSIWSPFAIIALAAFCIALINNLNIFELIFPVIQHPVFVQREPAGFLVTVFGCCGCFKRHQVDRSEEPSELDKMVIDHHVEKKEKEEEKAGSCRAMIGQFQILPTSLMPSNILS